MSPSWILPILIIRPIQTKILSVCLNFSNIHQSTSNLQVPSSPTGLNPILNIDPDLDETRARRKAMNLLLHSFLWSCRIKDNSQGQRTLHCAVRPGESPSSPRNRSAHYGAASPRVVDSLSFTGTLTLWSCFLCKWLGHCLQWHPQGNDAIITLPSALNWTELCHSWASPFLLIFCSSPSQYQYQRTSYCVVNCNSAIPTSDGSSQT